MGVIDLLASQKKTAGRVISTGHSLLSGDARGPGSPVVTHTICRV